MTLAETLIIPIGPAKVESPSSAPLDRNCHTSTHGNVEAVRDLRRFLHRRRTGGGRESGNFVSPALHQSRKRPGDGRGTPRGPHHDGRQPAGDEQSRRYSCDRLRPARSDNRRLTFVALSDSFYRSSTRQLDGSDAPRVHVMLFKSIPAGTYDIEVRVEKSDGSEISEHATASVLGETLTGKWEMGNGARGCRCATRSRPPRRTAQVESPPFDPPRTKNAASRTQTRQPGVITAGQEGE